MERNKTHPVVSSNHYFGSLESLRGIAALLIAGFHIPWWNPARSIAFMDSAYLMVDFFFVLSGFVIFHSYAKKLNTGSDIAQFMWLRFWRLFPLHLAFLLVFLAFEFIKFYSRENFGIEPSVPPFLQNNTATFISGLFLAHGMGLHDFLSFNYPSWSISVEFYTYLVFAGVIYFGRTQNTYIFLASLLVLFSASKLVVLGVGDLDVTYDYGIYRCVAGFFLGTLTYLLYARLRASSLIASFGETTLARMAPLFTIMFLIAFLTYKPGGMWDFAFPVISTILILLLTLFPDTSLSKLFDKKTFRWLGRVSYSVYMVHFAVIYIFSQFVRYIVGQDWTASPIIGDTFSVSFLAICLIAWIATLASILLVAHFTYKWIEVPFRDKSRQFDLRARLKKSNPIEPIRLASPKNSRL
ncbi:MAG: acyltransferase [Rhizobiales bacterium]|nr:acyltransferase [Hyphomicrobiales bacterium]